jgi:hypothetical protein
MGTIIVRNAVQRKPGYLYYVTGNGDIGEAVMRRGGKSKRKKRGRKPKSVIEQQVEQQEPQKKKSLFD